MWGFGDRQEFGLLSFAAQADSSSGCREGGPPRGRGAGGRQAGDPAGEVLERALRVQRFSGGLITCGWQHLQNPKARKLGI